MTTRSVGCVHALVNARVRCANPHRVVPPRQLAVAFANCHLEASGKATYQCEPSHTVQQCTSGMSDVAFTTYTEFFTHADNLCHFLQSEMWQERTEQTVNALASTSAVVADQLCVRAAVPLRLAGSLSRAHGSTESAMRQQSLLANQAKSLENERALLAQSSEVLHTVEETGQKIAVFEVRAAPRV